MAFDYCNAPLTDHELVNCGNWLKGSINAYAIIESFDNLADPSDPSDWLAAIAADEVRIVKQVKGEMPDPSVIEGENPIGGGRATVNDGHDYTLEIMDFNVSATNDTFYENLNPRTVGIAVFLPKSNEIKMVYQAVNFNARPIVPMASTEKQHYLVTASWEAPNNEFPVRYPAPAGIFTV